MKWSVQWEPRYLHIRGATRNFPNRFSVSSLKQLQFSDHCTVANYRVVFHRDREPFCGEDLSGPVDYFETDLPTTVQKIRIEDAGENDVVIPVPERITGT